MDWVSTDPDRPGVFAFGQQAYGVFAFGQLACGVVAIGQVARGVIAIGQGAVGIVAIGQAALGVLYAGGMIAIGGRGFGICLKSAMKPWTMVSILSKWARMAASSGFSSSSALNPLTSPPAMK